MESGNAISTPLLLQEPLFLLDSQCPLEAMHGFHWMRSLPSQFSMPIMSCCPILPSPGQSNFLAQTPLYLVTIQQLLVMQYFQRKYFILDVSPPLAWVISEVLFSSRVEPIETILVGQISIYKYLLRTVPHPILSIAASTEINTTLQWTRQNPILK